ncbi:MAG: UDP-3-O-acyl-N-acetylglucosamine deacetylase [Deltaproteobacteria bacterium]|nr:UDP-3-O-acyl-N-acetylglucosamine deacetylase [Deltaproteobacteria bacterium]MBW1812320.1 UDP-3-O-acyl-N-acetylglucosamine deacetylase [Deltaproteobacteria bacterium]MBW2365756.1 UDP-3-O-acyl-N-acetylglucosamine deacetylase [Deltaproteobacteria bacterium]
MNLYQQTIAKSVSISGVGLHSGKKVNLTINPAPSNHGIKFKRTDLPDSPYINAHFNMIVDTSLATVIGFNGFIISTIEHIMAAFSGLSIDNALVELDAHEVPVMDGSANPFTFIIQEAGIVKLDAPRYYFVIKEPIIHTDNDKSVTMYPSNNFKISYTIDFDHPLIKKQYYSLEVSEKTFTSEIAMARTFGFLNEYELMKKFGLAMGGSLDNAIVVDDQDIINSEGLRYPDEFVRHKLLDCIGDFALLGLPILGHVVLEKSGHSFNHSFIQKFFSKKGSWVTRTLQDLKSVPAFQSKSLAI